MAHFTLDDDGLVEDEHGDIDYDEAIEITVRQALNSIEMSIWDMVDDLEYIISAETVEPAEE